MSSVLKSDLGLGPGDIGSVADQLHSRGSGWLDGSDGLTASERASLVRPFAEAISRDGEAALIAQDNSIVRWTSIGDAVAADAAFMVWPKPWILAIDVDDEEDWVGARQLESHLPDNFGVVWCASGRDGHRHLWLIAPPGWDTAALKTRIAESAPNLRSDKVRMATAPTRPPYARHRWAGQSVVIDSDPQVALRLFEDARELPLDQKWRELLAAEGPGPTERNEYGQPFRSPLYRVALATVNRRWSFEQFVQLVEGATGHAAINYRQMSPERRRPYLRVLWDRALAYVRQHPQISHHELARAKVTELRRFIELRPWSPRTGATDRAVYGLLLRLADKIGELTVGASVREVSSDTSLGRDTAGRSLARLESMGLIRRVRLLAPEAHRFELLDVTERSTPADNRIYPLGGDSDPIVRTKALLADIFTHGRGLGMSRGETWEALPEQWSDTSLVAERTGKRQRVVQSHLRVLTAHGLAQRVGHRVRRRTPSDADLTLIAMNLDVLGKGEQIRRRNTMEQEQYLRFRQDKGWILPGEGR